MISSPVTTPAVVSDAAGSDQNSDVLLPHSAVQNPSAPTTGALVVEVIGKIIECQATRSLKRRTIFTTSTESFARECVIQFLGNGWR